MGPLARGQFFIGFKWGFGVLPPQGPQGGLLPPLFCRTRKPGRWKRFAKFMGLVVEWASELRSAGVQIPCFCRLLALFLISGMLQIDVR